MRKLNLAQRVVLVVALGFVCLAVDAYAGGRAGGWFGYAPGTDVAYVQDEGRTGRLALRVVLTAAWGTAAIFILRSPHE